MEKIFQRTAKLLGQDNMELLKKSSVAIIGLGGVGSYAAEAICRSGVGNIMIVDADIVEETNLNRQLPALTSTIGQYKANVLYERLRDINPNLNIIKHTVRINEYNQAELLAGHFDYVIDAIDTIADKLSLIQYCVNRKISIISSMGAANRLDPSKFKIDDIKNTSVCPLAKRVRKELRSRGINEGVKVVYSTEEPLKTSYEDDSRLGSIAFVPSSAGLLLASAVIRDLIQLN